MNILKLLSYFRREKQYALQQLERDNISDYQRGYWEGQRDCIDDAIAWAGREAK